MSSTRDAILKFSARQVKKTQRKKRNNSPEKEIVKQVLDWLNKNGFHAFVVESKAVFSQSAGTYLQGQTTPGVSDVLGTCPAQTSGRAMYCEVKAAQRRSTAKPHQIEFLTQTISRGGFGLVTDSVEHLERLYLAWVSSNYDKQILLDDLPRKVLRRSDQNSDLGF